MSKKNSSISIQISVTDSAKRRIDEITQSTDMPQKRVMSRIFEWFADLPFSAQRAILWPDRTADELDATLVALEFLQRRRAEAGLAAGAATAADSALAQAAGSAARPPGPPAQSGSRRTGTAGG